MRFIVATDRTITVAFEPSAAEHQMQPGDEVTVEWRGDVEDGRVEIERGQLVVHTPTAGHARAWNSAGVELYVGPDSGPLAR
jgi:hypothetical protein